MKTKDVTITTGNIYDPQMEEMLQKGSADLNELGIVKGKYFGKKNLPAPKGDDLASYTDEMKTGAEKLASEINHYLQPDAHFPESKIDADYYKEQDKNLEKETKEREDQNQSDEYELRDFHQGSIPARMKLALMITIAFTIGEIFFNTKAFQVTGDSMLFAFVISISISLGVIASSHFVPLLYKGAKSIFKKRLILIGSFLFLTILFIVLAYFRTTYLESHNVHVNPISFVIINLFFLIVSTVLSYFILPSWTELKQNARNLKIYSAINKRKKEIEQLKAKREEIKKTIMERTKMRIRMAHQANYAADRIRKMYWESMAKFKSNNLTYRTDGLTPDCFSKELPEPDIKDFIYTVNTLKNKE